VANYAKQLAAFVPKYRGLSNLDRGLPAPARSVKKAAKKKSRPDVRASVLAVLRGKEEPQKVADRFKVLVGTLHKRIHDYRHPKR
jgi:hypothetical protein